MAQDVAFMKSHGITGVVNMCIEWPGPREEYGEVGITQLHVSSCRSIINNFYELIESILPFPLAASHGGYNTAISCRPRTWHCIYCCAKGAGGACLHSLQGWAGSRRCDGSCMVCCPRPLARDRHVLAKIKEKRCEQQARKLCRHSGLISKIFKRRALKYF